MRQARHPLVEQDIIGIVDHIVATTESDYSAARRRLDEIDSLIGAIVANPMSGTRLHPPLDGWFVRHGGQGQRLTVVFKPDLEQQLLYIALIAFGGRDWISRTELRRVPDQW